MTHAGKLKQCIFCQPDPTLQILSTPNFNVIFDKFPICESHIIIHSKTHLGCAGEITDVMFEELAYLKKRISSLLESTYGAVSFYEHGRAGHCISTPVEERLCHHFHLHAIPLEIQIHTDLKKRLPFVSMPDYHNITTLFDRFGEYVFLESADGELLFFPVDQSLESHFIRSLIAKQLDRPEQANWEKGCNLEFSQQRKSGRRTLLKQESYNE